MKRFTVVNSFDANRPLRSESIYSCLASQPVNAVVAMVRDTSGGDFTGRRVVFDTTGLSSGIVSGIMTPTTEGDYVLILASDKGDIYPLFSAAVVTQEEFPF